MSDFCNLVDPFFGEGATEFPPKSGLAARWFFLKAQTGNTQPGACLPFGMVSACAYSGAYVTGYGVNAPSYMGRPAALFKNLEATGFAHFQHSGTGMVGSYYNYFRVVPQLNPGNGLNRRYALSAETAEPGYYTATLHECGIRAELTVTARGAAHRYTFPPDATPTLSIDFAAGGLAIPGMQTTPSTAAIRLTEGGFEGHVVMEGIPIFVCGILRPAAGASHLFVNGSNLADRQIAYQPGANLPASFGVALAVKPGADGTCELLLAFSMKSVDRARRHLASFRTKSFDALRASARSRWNEHLGKIVVDGPAQSQSLFYSSLYHSFVKPCNLAGESPFYDRPEACFTDFATLWDQYKTALPLILTLFPDTGRDIVNALLGMAEHVGEFPNALMLNRDFTRFDSQARGLTHHVLADALTRRLDGIAWDQALLAMLADLEKKSNADFHSTGIAKPFTHTLDLAEASFCTALVAAAQSNTAIRDRTWPWAARWKNVFDPATGILGPSDYYEGGPWNYSFRLLHDMQARIALHGGDAPFVRDFEKFFGYGAAPVRQPTDPDDWQHAQRNVGLNRFQGFNNEPDMETPYAFVYAGRHDRTCEVVRNALANQFHPGRGGLPGNNDSGGLTSAYCWNAIGLFPVAGQPYMLIGSPIFETARLTLPESELVITARGTSADNIYVRRASLNGHPLERAWLSMKEFLHGGELVLEMASRPEGWAKAQRPPAYTSVEQLNQGDF